MCKRMLPYNVIKFIGYYIFILLNSIISRIYYLKGLRHVNHIKRASDQNVLGMADPHNIQKHSWYLTANAHCLHHKDQSVNAV
jgi:hypothetical protein